MSAVTRACQNYFNGPAELTQPGHKVAGALKCISYIFILPIIIMGFIWGVSSTIDLIKDRFSKKPPQIADKVSQTVQTKEPLKANGATPVALPSTTEQLVANAHKFASTKVSDFEKEAFLVFIKRVVENSDFQANPESFLKKQPWFQSRVIQEHIPVFDPARDFLASELNITPREGTRRHPDLDGWGEVLPTQMENFLKAKDFIKNESEDKKEQFLNFIKQVLSTSDFLRDSKGFLQKQDWFKPRVTADYIFPGDAAAAFFRREFFPNRHTIHAVDPISTEAAVIPKKLPIAREMLDEEMPFENGFEIINKFYRKAIEFAKASTTTESIQYKNAFLKFVKKVIKDHDFIRNPTKFLENQEWYHESVQKIYALSEARRFFHLNFPPLPALPSEVENKPEMIALFSKAKEYVLNIGNQVSHRQKRQFLEGVNECLVNPEFQANPKEFIKKQPWFERGRVTMDYVSPGDDLRSFFSNHFNLRLGEIWETDPKLKALIAKSEAFAKDFDEEKKDIFLTHIKEIVGGPGFRANPRKFLAENPSVLSTIPEYQRQVTVDAINAAVTFLGSELFPEPDFTAIEQPAEPLPEVSVQPPKEEPKPGTAASATIDADREKLRSTISVGPHSAAPVEAAGPRAPISKPAISKENAVGRPQKFPNIYFIADMSQQYVSTLKIPGKEHMLKFMNSILEKDEFQRNPQEHLQTLKKQWANAGTEKVKAVDFMIKVLDSEPHNEQALMEIPRLNELYKKARLFVVTRQNYERAADILGGDEPEKLSRTLIDDHFMAKLKSVLYNPNFQAKPREFLNSWTKERQLITEGFVFPDDSVRTFLMEELFMFPLSSLPNDEGKAGRDFLPPKQIQRVYGQGGNAGIDRQLNWVDPAKLAECPAQKKYIMQCALESYKKSGLTPKFIMRQFDSNDAFNTFDRKPAYLALAVDRPEGFPPVKNTEEFYDYVSVSGTPEKEYWVDFANKHLGGGVFGNRGFVQEEIEACETPELLAVCADTDPRTKEGYRTRTGSKKVMRGSPSPLILEGVHCVLHLKPISVDKDTGKKKILYGNMINTFPMEQLKTLVEPLEPPVKYNMLAIAAPDLGYGNTKDQLKFDTIFDLFNTAFAGFSLTGKGSFVHTGLLGCGAFSNHYLVGITAQMFAAHILGVTLKFHGISDKQMQEASAVWDRAFSVEAPNKMTIEEGLKRLWSALNFPV